MFATKNIGGFTEKEKVALFSTLVNFLLGLMKIATGLVLNSKAILADGVHSFTDVFSSFSSFIGLKVSSKKADEMHPYGYYSAEALAGAFIVVLIFISSIEVIYEGIDGVLKNEKAKIEAYGFAIVVISIVANEALARLKFSVGKREKSLSLVSDAEHSRIDVLSSIGVLASLALSGFIPFIDGVTAVAIGLFILFESYPIGREVVDNLLGAADKETEEKIKEYCKAKNIELASVKTRKSGSAIFAEIEIKLPKNLSVSQAERITKEIREELLNKVQNLKFIVVQVSSHDVETGFLKPMFGRGYGWRGGIGEKVTSPEKQGYRILIPFKDGKIYNDFGAPEYLIIDKDKETGRIIRKEVLKNPYFGIEEKARGMRIIKAAMPDEVVTKEIGAGAKQRLKEFGIKLKIVGEDFDINKI